MKLDVRKFVAAAILMMLFMPVMQAARQPAAAAPAANALTETEARQAILKAGYTLIEGMFGDKFFRIETPTNGARFTHDTLWFNLSQAAPGAFLKIDLKSLESASVNCNRSDCGLHVKPPQAFVGKSHLVWRISPDVWKCPKKCRQAAESFAAALNRLHELANDDTAANEFRRQATEWRALSSKPPIPEAVRELNLLPLGTCSPI